MAKMLGRQAELYYGAVASATSFVKIPQLRTISEIRKTSPRVNVTDLDAAAEQYLSGLPDPSSITVTGLWDPLNAVHQQMDTDQRAGTVRYWRLRIFRAGAVIRLGTFQGYVAEFGTGPFENQAAVDMSIVIQLSGDISWS